MFENSIKTGYTTIISTTKGQLRTTLENECIVAHTMTFRLYYNIM